MSRVDIEELLDRYLKGEASAEETERVESWLDNTGNPNSGWEQMDKTAREKWLSALFEQVQDTAGIGEAKIVAMNTRRNLWRTVAAIAAMLAIFFSTYFAWPVLQSHFYPAELASLKVPLNQKKQVMLADGSSVWVNQSSELKYPKVFNGKTREVYLSGEAYFDIRHDAAKPFIIHTGKVNTTVLGTAFNIKEDNATHTIVITVTRGKVGVANGKALLGIITPNQQISFNTLNNHHVQQDVDARQVIAWQQSAIRFEDITFAEAAAQLQERFKVKISFSNDRIKNCRFTGTALDGEKLDKILKVVCAFNNATYTTKADGSITIDGPGCN